MKRPSKPFTQQREPFSVRLPQEQAQRQYGDRCGQSRFRRAKRDGCDPAAGPQPDSSSSIALHFGAESGCDRYGQSRSPSRSDEGDPAARLNGEREAIPGKPLKKALRIRALILSLYFVLFTIPYGTLCLLIFPWLGTARRYAWAAAWCRATLWMLRTVCGITHRIEGWDHLPDGPAVLLSKHQSAWETLGLIVLMPRRLCFVFKRELLLVPFFGWVLGLLRMIWIDRRKGRHTFASILQQSHRCFKEGAWVVLFPEGTRMRVGTRGVYKTGGARLAVLNGVPVIPVAHNAGHVWSPDTFIKYPGTVTVSIGPAIQTTGLTHQQVNARVEEWIEMEMRRIDADAYIRISASPPQT